MVEKGAVVLSFSGNWSKAYHNKITSEIGKLCGGNGITCLLQLSAVIDISEAQDAIT